MAADGSKSQASGSGGDGSDGPRTPCAADEVIERGLGMYSQGHLQSALAEWRHALELEPHNQRAAEYVAYVEEHFPILDQKFRAARLKRAQQGEAIEIEADEPMDDLDAYESIELETGSPESGAEQARRSEAPASAEQLASEHGGHDEPSVAAPDELALDALDEGWSLDGLPDLWASSRDDIQTVEIARQEREARPDTEPSAEQPVEQRALPGLAETLPASPAGSHPRLAAFDFEDAQAPTVERGPMRGSVDADGIRDAFSDSMPDVDPGTGEITLPAVRSVRPLHDSRTTTPDTPRGLAASLRDAPAPSEVGFDLSDFDSGLSIGEDEAAPAPRRDAEEARSKTAPGGTAAPPGADRPHLADVDEPDTPEVRVTFRLPQNADSDGDGDEEELTFDRRPTGVAQSGPADSIGVAIAEAVNRANAGASDGPPADTAGEPGSARVAGGGDPVSVPLPDSAASNRRRPPTEDPDIEVSSVVVDETLLSFEDQTQELPSAGLLINRPSQIDRAGTAPVAEVVVPPPDEAAAASDGGDDDEEDEEEEAEGMTTELYHRPLAGPQTAVSAELMLVDLESELDQHVAGLGVEGDELTRARINWLIERARSENRGGQHAVAVVAVDLALEQDPTTAVAQKLIHSNEELLQQVYYGYLGDLRQVPTLSLPLESIPVDELDHRAAFLLSRVDGVLTLEDVLDVSGMSRLEAFRHLCRLLLRGILGFRS